MLNPMQIMKAFNINDPMQLIDNMISKNPQLAQYANMAKRMTEGKSQKEIQNIANNLLNQKGMNMGQIEKMFNQFMNGGFKL